MRSGLHGCAETAQAFAPEYRDFLISAAIAVELAAARR
jgi:hypothetical protein